VNYDIRESQLPRPHATCVLDRASIGGGKFVSGGVGIAVGVKDNPIRLGRDTYFAKMEWLTRQYVILWDEGEHRGWLVNGASALLHIVHASLEHDLEGKLRSQILFKKDKMKGPTPSHMSDSALDVLMNAENKRLPIHIDKVETWTEEVTPEEGGSSKTETKTKTTHTLFEHRVEQLYGLLEQIMDHQIHIEGRAGVELKLRVRQYLEGWDFRDLAIRKDPIYPRVKTLQAMGKGWVDFTRKINAITIFGKGFGDIIRPTDAASMCGSWARLPPGRYYLAACVSDLKDIMQMKANVHQCTTPMRICDGIDWHAPNNLFRPCQCGKTAGNKVEHSDVAQVLAPSKMVFRTQPKTSGTVELKHTGAIVFGYSSILKLCWPDQGSPKESDIPTRMAVEASEGESDFHDSAIGTSPAPATTGSSEVQASTRPDRATAAPSIGVGTFSVAALESSGTQESTRLTDMSIPSSQHVPGETSGHAIDGRVDVRIRYPPADQVDAIEDPVDERIEHRPANEVDDGIDCPTSRDVTTEPLESLTARPPSRVERSASDLTNEHGRSVQGNVLRRNVGRRLKLWFAKVKLGERIRRLTQKTCK
jgi:hypothetical protein